MLRYVALALFLLLPTTTAVAEDGAGKIETIVTGVISTNLIYNSGSPDRIDLFQAATNASSERTFTISSRQSQIGIRIACSKGCERSISGVLELDFFGLLSQSSEEGILAASPRLRRAFVEANIWGLSVLMGQEELRTFSPLTPYALGRTAIPLFSGFGNHWLRVPQVKIEREVPVTEQLHVDVAFALLRPTGTDSLSLAGKESASSGTKTALPFVQGRIGADAALGTAVVDLGISGMYGQRRVSPGNVEIVWGGSVDVSAELWQLRILGEAAYGSNLGPFHAICDSTVFGGWVQLVWGDPLGVCGRVSYGQEQVSSDVTTGCLLEANESFEVACGFPFLVDVRGELQYAHVNSTYMGQSRSPSNDQVMLTVAYFF
jgi:hypothetical protein